MLSDADLRRLGISGWACISPEQIPFDPEVRRICAGNGCRSYGATWACPPAVGTLEQCRQRCLSYDQALVFCAAYPLEDPFDFEGMALGHRSFKDLCDELYQAVKLECPSFLLLSNEGCIRCQSCTYPDAPCRFPDILFPALEGYGIQVIQLAKAAGLNYKTAKAVTYFGVLLH